MFIDRFYVDSLFMYIVQYYNKTVFGLLLSLEKIQLMDTKYA